MKCSLFETERVKFMGTDMFNIVFFQSNRRLTIGKSECCHGWRFSWCLQSETATAGQSSTHMPVSEKCILGMMSNKLMDSTTWIITLDGKWLCIFCIFLTAVSLRQTKQDIQKKELWKEIYKPLIEREFRIHLEK